eukprot:3937723-Rhodomonas_salina.1
MKSTLHAFDRQYLGAYQLPVSVRSRYWPVCMAGLGRLCVAGRERKEGEEGGREGERERGREGGLWQPTREEGGRSEGAGEEERGRGREDQRKGGRKRERDGREGEGGRGMGGGVVRGALVVGVVFPVELVAAYRISAPPTRGHIAICGISTGHWRMSVPDIGRRKGVGGYGDGTSRAADEVREMTEGVGCAW